MGCKVHWRHWVPVPLKNVRRPAMLNAELRVSVATAMLLGIRVLAQRHVDAQKGLTWSVPKFQSETIRTYDV